MKDKIKITLEYDSGFNCYYVTKVHNTVTHKPGDELKPTSVDVLCKSPAYDVIMIERKRR